MKFTADQYYYVYFCMFEETAMFKLLSYSSEFVSLFCFQRKLQGKKHTSRQSRSLYVNHTNTGISILSLI